MLPKVVRYIVLCIFSVSLKLIVKKIYLFEKVVYLFSLLYKLKAQYASSKTLKKNLNVKSNYY